MLKTAFVEEIRGIEAAANAKILTYQMMMENAGRAVARRVQNILSGTSNATVIILVGPGNNGGDGLVAGRIIAQENNFAVHFYLLKSRTTDDKNFKMVVDAKLSVALAEQDEDGLILSNLIERADVVVDAVFGIGARLPLDSGAAEILQRVKRAINDCTQSSPGPYDGSMVTPSIPEMQTPALRPYVIALDCPSGLNCDTGEIDHSILSADETITFIAAKPGLFEFPGASYTGRLSIASIGVPDTLLELAGIKRTVADSESIGKLLPPRPANANKGTFGKVMVLGGSSIYVGAVGLAAMSAYRSGSGLVTICAIQSVITALSARLLEPTWLMVPDEQGAVSLDGLPMIRAELNNMDSLLVGPGLGTSSTTKELLVHLLKDRDGLPPLVLDADALNMLSTIDNWWTMVPHGTVITPHPGEMARLANTTIGEIQGRRWQYALSKAAEWQVVLVLKGAHTLIADPDGNVSVIPFATAALATAGTGDVLAGLIAGFLGQGLASYSAALVAAYIHGVAGTYAEVEVGNARSVVASDVLTAISGALSKLEITRSTKIAI